MTNARPTIPTLDQIRGPRSVRSRLGRHVVRDILSRRGLGLLVVLLSAASFGAVTPFARLAYNGGVNVVTVMAVRYALAGLAVMGYLAWRRQLWRLAGRRLWQTLGVVIGIFTMCRHMLAER